MEVDVGTVDIQTFTIDGISPFLYVFIVSWMIYVLAVVVYVGEHVSRVRTRRAVGRRRVLLDEDQ